MKIRTCLFTLFFLSSVLGASEGLSATPSKMAPALTIVSQTGVAPASTKALKSLYPGQGPFVETLVKFQGSLSGVEALGGRVRSIIGDIATVDLPIGALPQVSNLPNIVYIESSKRVKRRLNASVPDTGATLLRSGTPPNWSGATGKGVVIGIIDSGIDLSHNDFKDSCGNTRIVSVWDQAAASGTPPAGYTYGKECTQTAIDAGQCGETDTDGHGSHVAGIAAGNGSAGSTPYKYAGMAPEADIIIVNSLNPSVTTNTAVFDAISYIQAKAAALGESSVINLSFGGHVDPHDGTSVFEQALDNASGAGSVLVCAAGNEADKSIHASGTVANGGATTVNFSVPAAGRDLQDFDLWYAGADQMAISLNFGSTCSVGPVNPGTTKQFSTSCGRITVANSGGVNPSNGDNEIYVTIDNNNGANPISQGTWSFTLAGTSVTNGRFDVWIDDTVTTNGTFNDHVDTTITLDDCGTATKPVSVGAYITKNTWNSKSGLYGITANIGAIAVFSSLGPRRSCSNTANCPSVQKPDMAAPGEVVMSSYSAQSSAPSMYVDPDGVHVIEAGTSMSAPHVAGAIALILEKAPTLTSDQVKSYLTSNTKTDSTGAVPNNTWGYGKLDAHAAFNATPGTLPPSGSQVACTNKAASGGSSGGGGGCFIATAAYGSYLDHHVIVLREFRDRYLLTNGPGRAFVGLYYRFSPPAADFIRRHEALRASVRFVLTPLVFGIEYPGAAVAIVFLGMVVIMPLRSRIKRHKQ
jgi:subtilisin family serine protease